MQRLGCEHEPGDAEAAREHGGHEDDRPEQRPRPEAGAASGATAATAATTTATATEAPDRVPSSRASQQQRSV